MVEAGPHPADFVDQLRYINGRGFPDDSAADTLADEPLTGTLRTFSLRSASSSSDNQTLIRFVLLRMASPFSRGIGVEALSSGRVRLLSQGLC